MIDDKKEVTKEYIERINDSAGLQIVAKNDEERKKILKRLEARKQQLLEELEKKRRR